MKTFYSTLLCCLFWGLHVFSQTPQAFNYQGIARDTSGNILSSQTISLRLSILNGSINGTPVYVESHIKTTDGFGLFTLKVGQGSVISGNLNLISWGSSSFYLKVEMDPNGGSAYQWVGTNQFLSVPYALYAAQSGTGGATGATGAQGITGKTGASGANGDKFSASSTTTLTIGTGVKNITVGSGMGYINGQTVLLYNSSNNYMIGNVTTYNSGTGVLSVNIVYIVGAGSFSYWDVSLTGTPGNSGANGYTGAQGLTGQTGAIGAQGLSGKTGSTGTSGFTGSTGSTGPTGPLVTGSAGQTLRNDGSAWVANSLLFNNNTSIGIGTSSPNAAAALEISSTTQGFLPPRLTQAQMLALTPVEGLIIYNTTIKLPLFYNGTYWSKMDGNLYLWLGQSYQGGIIAYIFQPGDAGYVSGETHGIIAAPSNQSTAASWGCYGVVITGADGIILGTGNQNTTDILSGCATAGIAAKICADLSLGGYTDWYLPSKDELHQLYLNRAIIGGFTSNYYWSSTEATNQYAWSEDFSSGVAYQTTKSWALGYVRAIRNF